MRSTFIKHTLLSLAAVSIFWICNAHDQVPGTKQAKPILLTNGTIHTVTGATISNGQLLFENGRITAVSRRVDVPDNCEVIDVEGKHVYPGLISSVSSIGLVEINSVRATIDFGELGSFNPNIRAEVAVNPDSELIPVTRANGVLVAHVMPSTYRGGLIGGSTAVMKLDGWTTEDMTLSAPVAMSITWPRDPRTSQFHPEDTNPDNAQKAEENYATAINKLEDAFKDARAFWKAKNKGDKTLDVDLRWEALAPVLNKTAPAHVYADSARQIRDAVHWAKREAINLVIFGGTDAWRLTELLSENDVAVVVGGVNKLPRQRWESYDTQFRNTVKLHQAGVKFAIGYASRGANERNLPYEAGKAVAHGLPKEEALKAITIYPAEILGVANRLGSLEAGKDATLIVTTGDPLDIRSNVEMAFIEGRTVDLSSRHTQLYEKYQQRYQQN
ncbi:MAG: amidohydrolase family protein [Verrucomicrobia bacterium]|nr:amidohydrolase family protein [Verrucomicrobiota bacterium]